MTDTVKAFSRARAIIEAALSEQFRARALRMVNEIESLVAEAPSDADVVYRGERACTRIGCRGCNKIPPGFA